MSPFFKNWNRVSLTTQKVPGQKRPGIFRSLSYCFVLLALGSCLGKVDIFRQTVNFEVFNVYWFEEEKTLFVFYSLTSQEMWSDKYRVEVNLEPSTVPMEWVDVQTVESFHIHEPGQCRELEICGSFSFRSEENPGSLSLRYRFHEESEIADQTQATTIQMSGLGQFGASLYIYGVFDETNRYVQWRGIHNFPGLNPSEVHRLGLRRQFEVQDFYGGPISRPYSSVNPSLFAEFDSCSGTFWNRGLVQTDWSLLRWMDEAIPVDLEDEPAICATAIVSVPDGVRQDRVVARKNQKIEDVIDNLSLRFNKSVNVPYIIASCQAMDQGFLEFQKARLQVTQNDIDFCFDEEELSTSTIEARIADKLLEARRATSQDLALIVILHYLDENATTSLFTILYPALQRLMDPDLYPFRSVAFVYSSDSIEQSPNLDPSVVWCPALSAVDGENPFELCQFVPENVVLGPLEVQLSPSLPSYASYRNMNQAQRDGFKIQRFEVWIPEQPSFQGQLEYVSSGVGANWIFHPDDMIQVASEDKLSYCSSADTTKSIGYRTRLNDDSEAVDAIELTPSVLFDLPNRHHSLQQSRIYQLGLISPTPFLITVYYESTASIGPRGALGVLKIDRSQASIAQYGDLILNFGTIKVGRALRKCVEHCEFPAFNDLGVYQLNVPWSEEYQTKCFQPLLPRRS